MDLWIGAEICRTRRLPVQLHVGFGDPDIYMHACDPTHFTDFIAAMESWDVPITLLHNWPFLKEAQWLSEVFQNVYYDAGVILNYGAAESESILREALQIGKFQKFLFSTTHSDSSELYYLGAFLFRRAFARILDSWIAEDSVRRRMPMNSWSSSRRRMRAASIRACEERHGNT